jgi:hypothetical protein
MGVGDSTSAINPISYNFRLFDSVGQVIATQVLSRKGKAGHPLIREEFGQVEL